MLLLGNVLSWTMFLGGLLLMILILLRRWHRYYGPRRAGKPPAAPSRRISTASDRAKLLDAPPEILQWQVEMHETARDLKAELDSKISVLQTLITMARKESERLESLVQRG